MTMTDAELDRDWQPNGRRPQSTIARSFSQELGDIFRIEDSLTDLDNKVDQRFISQEAPAHGAANNQPPACVPLLTCTLDQFRRQNVGKNNQELADIEARIREMEDRLRRSQQSRPALPTGASTFSSQKRADATQSPKDNTKPWSRPGTARPSQPAPSSGRMPPTPGASEGEYHVVTQADLDPGSG
ncbi:hypothetical protein OCS_00367 [Ophiocordyceps sinensis CO18]|uniref:Uncharacterized protein n=1 Tax=Ophiocordyceps sinensis (strain Co18 / CGMCC 3.14243) TaxID=911162 RepID=T5AMV0_OPHSC|nr:hypothetical protein OCS_00367 [Ophiocordyceps sinensis CO18]